MKPSHTDRWKIVLGTAVILALGALLAPSLEAALSIVPLVRHAHWPWLAAALLCQAAMYACVAQILAVALSTMKIRDSLPNLYFPAVIFLFANRAVPGPAIAGLAALVYLLGKRGVAATNAQVAAGSFYLADYASFFVVIVFAAITLLAGSGLRANSQGTYLAATGIIVLMFAAGWIAYSQATHLISRSVKIVRKIERGVRPEGSESIIAAKTEAMLSGLHRQSQALLREPAALGKIVGTGVAMHAWEALTLVCAARGFGARLSFGAAAGAYVAGNLAAIVSFLPGGVGLFDGAMISVLHSAGRLPLPAAGAATVVYRLLSLALPFPFALTAIRHSLAPREEDAR